MGRSTPWGRIAAQYNGWCDKPIESIGNAMANHFKKIIITALLAMGIWTSAHADLVHYSVVDSDGVTHEVPAGTAESAPAVGSDMSFAVTAGVERKVRVAIETSGNVLSENTSGVIGPNDVFEHDGQTYSGASLSLPAPGIGGYELRTQILNLDGQVVSEEVQSLVLHDGTPVVPPELEADTYACTKTTSATCSETDTISTHERQPTSGTRYSELSYDWHVGPKANNSSQGHGIYWGGKKIKSFPGATFQYPSQWYKTVGHRGCCWGVYEHTYSATSVTVNGWTYKRGPLAKTYEYTIPPMGEYMKVKSYRIYRERGTTTTTCSAFSESYSTTCEGGRSPIEEALASSQCTDANSTKNVDGFDYTSDCWAWDEDYRIDSFVFNGLTYNQKTKTFSASVVETSSGFVRFDASKLEVKQADGAWVELAASENLSTGGQSRAFTYAADSAPDGVYTMARATFVDAEGGTKTVEVPGEFIVDTEAPSITVNGLQDNDVISSFEGVTLAVQDAMDSNPDVQRVTFEGGPNNTSVSLPAVSKEGGVLGLEQPSLLPSLKETDVYTLAIHAVDHSANASTEQITFRYMPEETLVTDSEGQAIKIPAVPRAFANDAGLYAINTIQLQLTDGTTLTGEYELQAMISTDSTTPVTINGVTVQPGDPLTPVGSIDFTATNGHINLPVAAVADGATGEATVTIVSSAPGSPVIKADVSVWDGLAEVLVDKDEVYQVLVDALITAVPASGTSCRFTNQNYVAQEADVLSNPMCLVEWTQYPEKLSPAQLPGNETPALGGSFLHAGPQQIDYSVSVYSAEGEKVVLTTGTYTVESLDPAGILSYEPSEDVSEVYQIIEQLDITLNQTSGPECRLTMNEEAAKRYAGNPKQNTPTCLLKWTALPTGLEQDSYQSQPWLFGALQDAGEQVVEWEVSVFTNETDRLVLATESYDMNATTPPAPNLSFTSAVEQYGDIYAVSNRVDYLGDAIVESQPAPIHVTIKRNETTDTDETFAPGYGYRGLSKIYRRLNVPATALWEESVFDIEATYAEIPVNAATMKVTAITVPGEGVYPDISTALSEVLDTAPLTVSVSMKDMYKPDVEYAAELMGEWEVRLLREESFDESVPITEFTEAVDGQVNFEVDISGIDRSIRLVAEARLISPVESYERTELSRRLFLTVLKGGEIDASVESKRLSGPAPFTTILQLSVEERDYRSAVGDVTWEVSADGGATWEGETSSERDRFRWYDTFEEGNYWVRAKIKNQHSGVESYTAPVEVIAYKVLEAEVEGPQTMFVGTEATYSVIATGPDGEIISDAVVKWTDDRGRSFFQEGGDLVLNASEPERMSFEAWVRDPNAPDDDRYAYTRARASADFRAIKGPRVYLNGPRRIETGKTHQFDARMSAPYRGMDVEMAGEFVLPNGDRVPGLQVDYMPTQADLESRSIEIKYVGWVEGYRDHESETTRDLRTRVWEYVWPEFSLYTRERTNMAPADVTARVRMLGYRGELDNPIYQWEFTPSEGIEVTAGRWEDVKTLRFTEPGTYNLKVTVSDARGNEAVVEGSIDIIDPPPYDVEIKYSASNEYNRAPLEIRMRPYVTGGHSEDRVSEYTYTVNEEPIEAIGYNARTTLDVGSNEVSLTIKTEMGVEATKVVNVDVAENQAPYCQIEIDERYSSWQVYAVCEDVDGNLESYDWKVNGESIALSGNKVSLTKSTYEGNMPPVEVMGYDDAGAVSNTAHAN